MQQKSLIGWKLNVPLSLTVLLGIVFLFGCNPPHEGDQLLKKVSVNAVERPYSVYLPSNLTYPAKLICFINGAAESYKTARVVYEEASRRNYIVVALEGMKDSEHYYFALGGVRIDIRGWGLSAEFDHPGHPDLEYLDAVLAEILNDYSIDVSHIHLIGKSNGGFLLNMFAGYRSELIASIATVCAGIVVPNRDGSKGWDFGFRFVDPLNRIENWYPSLKRTYPIFMISGEKDPLVSINNVKTARDKYIEEGFPVVDYRVVKDLYHAWPARGNNVENFDASLEILEFFDRHPADTDSLLDM